MNTLQRTTFGALITVAAVGLSACGSSTDSATTAGTTTTVAASSPIANGEVTSTTSAAATETKIDVSYKGGAITPAPTRYKVAKGNQVSITVTSDVADEIHLHGYDRKVDLQPNAAGTLTFTADITGVFEVELENLGKQLFELQVS